uniref:NR LBD domain-containing protein n=1 Tax=Micrurus carvalhoi TaxID=3147026 RepID=A0A2H6MWR2_9SAUR
MYANSQKWCLKAFFFAGLPISNHLNPYPCLFLHDYFPSQQACPVNCHPHGYSGRTFQEIREDFSLSFVSAVREVVEFAKHIPGFQELSQHDQVSLLKAGTFEVGKFPPTLRSSLVTSY